MKIIHTADLHIGKKLYEQSLAENHEAFFAQLAQIVAEEKPEALLLSGDIFDSCNPSVESQETYNEGLLNIHNANPTTQIVVMSGNHDSAARLGVNAKLWSAHNVHVVTELHRDANRMPLFDKNIITITDAEGQPCALVGVVPFAYEANFPRCADDISNNVCSYYRGLVRRMNEMNTSGLPVILMGHLAVSGNIDVTGHRNNGTIGGMDTLDVTDFGSGYDYFALGHIHRMQPIAGTGDRAWYSGSPVAANFDEDYMHGVNLVTFEGRTATVQNIPIGVPHKLVTFPTETVPFPDAVQMLETYGGADYIRLNVWANTTPQNAIYEVQKMVDDKNLPFKVLYIHPNLTDEEKAKNAAEIQQLDLHSFREVITPMQIAKNCLKSELDGLEEILTEAINHCNDKCHDIEET